MLAAVICSAPSAAVSVLETESNVAMSAKLQL